MRNTTIEESVRFLQNGSRFPKKEVTPLSVPTVQVSNTEWNHMVNGIAKIHAETFGGTVSEYKSVKDDADQTVEYRRIYGSGTAENSGNIVDGSLSTSVMAFQVSAGDKFMLSGLMNDPSNPSLCWAVYSSYITLGTDSTTEAALKAAFMFSASDPSNTEGRTDIGTTLTMPAGAAMLVVSIPYENDESDVQKYSETEYEGVVPDINGLKQTATNHTGRIGTLENGLQDLDDVVRGDSQDEYDSVKSSGTLHEQWRLYGNGQGGGGYIVAGDSSANLISFRVNPGEMYRLTGLKNSDNNPSLCWAVYDTYITPGYDSATVAAMTNAFIASASDQSNTDGRTGVSATISMPYNAAMLIVSVPATNDNSTIAKKEVTLQSSLVEQSADLRTKVFGLQEKTTNLPTLEQNVSALQTSSAKQATRIALLDKCVAADVKGMISAQLNRYGIVNGGRITNDGKITHGADGNTTYIIALSAFNQKLFSAMGLASNANNASRCWAVYNIPEADVDWSDLSELPYELDWSEYLMSTYSDTSTEAGRTGQSVDLLDLTNTGATFLVFSCLTASADGCSVSNYDTEAIDNIGANAEKAAELVTLKNVLGRPSAWNARTSATTSTLTATMTLQNDYANVKVVTSAAMSGQHGLWLGFEAHNVVAGHKYLMLLRYKGKSGVWGASYYNSSLTWSGDGYVRNNLTDESDYNKWQFDKGGQFFTAPSGGDLWIDFIVYVTKTTSGAETVAEFDMLPMLIDVTGTNLTCDALVALIEKTGVFFESMVMSNFGINSLFGPTSETLVTLGDSTTGMMCWQPQLARMKGWNWDQRQIEGRTFNGVGAPYTAMGIGGTCVEPVIYGDGTSTTGCSQYIRARYVKYYEPTVIIVMCSYNGAHNGAHWGNDPAKPVQPDDYGLAALKATGMNYTTGTYNGTYTGEEIDLVSNPSQSAPSFAAAYFGMIHRLITDNPIARIVLVTLMTDFETTNTSYLELKNEVIRHASEVFHLPLVEANRAGLNRVNILTTRYDQGGVHFNENGGLLLAKHIAANC